MQTIRLKCKCACSEQEAKKTKNEERIRKKKKKKQIMLGSEYTMHIEKCCLLSCLINNSHNHIYSGDSQGACDYIEYS